MTEDKTIQMPDTLMTPEELETALGKVDIKVAKDSDAGRAVGLLVEAGIQAQNAKAKREFFNWLEVQLCHEELRDTAITYDDEGKPIMYAGQPGHWLADSFYQTLRKWALGEE